MASSNKEATRLEAITTRFEAIASSKDALSQTTVGHVVMCPTFFRRGRFQRDLLAAGVLMQLLPPALRGDAASRFNLKFGVACLLITGQA